MRICLVYDCLFPHTVGGAERWYRDLALRLAAEGHEVTYLTLRQWARGADPDLPGVKVLVAGPRMALYSGPGQRRILPPLVFGGGVLWHLLRRGRRYDVVHTASFPYFSVLAAAVARRVHRFRLVVDWIEFWSRDYWREYLGRVGGAIGWAVQRRCVRAHQRAFTFSQRTADRLREHGLRGDVTPLRGLYGGSTVALDAAPSDLVVVVAGRQIPEKRTVDAVQAIAMAAEQVPGLRGVVFGDGPDHPLVLETIRRLGAEAVVHAPGFVEREDLENTLRRALCLLHPSRREGYGLVVVEAASMAVPVVVAEHPDNAAVELVEDGINGVVAADGSPAELASAIVRVHDAGMALRTATSEWFAGHAGELTIDASLDRIVAAYGAGA